MTVAGLRLDVPAAGLAAATQQLSALRAEQLGRGADLLAGPFDDTRAHVWWLDGAGDGPIPGDLREQCAARVSEARLIAFTATLLADEGTAPAETAPFGLPIPFAVPESELDGLDLWYAEEHSPMLLSVPGWHRIRRYAVTTEHGEAWNRLTLHDLAGPEVMDDPGVEASRRTARRLAFLERPWFMSGGRGPLERV
jgi:hypothetical protein